MQPGENPFVEQLILASQIFRSEGAASVSLIQREMGLGYNAAINIVETLEALGCISSPNEFGKRLISCFPSVSVGNHEEDTCVDVDLT